MTAIFTNAKKSDVQNSGNFYKAIDNMKRLLVQMTGFVLMLIVIMRNEASARTVCDIRWRCQKGAKRTQVREGNEELTFI